MIRKQSGFVAVEWLPMRVGSGLVCGLLVAGLVACAANGVTDDDPSTGYLATSPLDAGDEHESVVLPPPSQDKNDGDDAGADDDAGGGGGGTTDAGGGDAGGGGTGGGTGGTGSCNATNTCMGAQDLGMVSGDTGADSKSTTGFGSRWLTVRVTEDDSSAFGAKLWLKSQLTSPAGSNYDLYVYVPGSDTRECAAVTQKSTTSATSDSASVSFGEGGTFSNGSDDSRTVTVEVRWVSGPCNASSPWSLNLYGNQL